MAPLKCLIVDDEPLALDVLEEYIGRLDFLTLAGRCSNGIEAINFLQKHKVDLLFLDIQMPFLTGVDLLRHAQSFPKVIFTTAYREYALEGYELNVVDYLLKPIAFERFVAAIQKIFTLLPSPLPEVPKPKAPASSDVFLYVKADKKMVKVYTKDIMYLEALSDYIRIKTAGSELLCYQRLNYFEAKLQQHHFLRIHKSYIINLQHIKAFTATDVEMEGIQIPIGRFYREQVLQRLSMDSFNDG